MVNLALFLLVLLQDEGFGGFGIAEGGHVVSSSRGRESDGLELPCILWSNAIYREGDRSITRKTARVSFITWTNIHTNRHYKRASGALLVYDVTSRSSFENAEKVWLRELKNAADSNSSLLDSLVLVGNKVGRFGRSVVAIGDSTFPNLHALFSEGG